MIKYGLTREKWTDTNLYDDGLVWDHCGSAAGALDKGVVNAGPMKELSVADG
jgi:hypothetical protein